MAVLPSSFEQSTFDGLRSHLPKSAFYCNVEAFFFAKSIKGPNLQWFDDDANLVLHPLNNRTTTDKRERDIFRSKIKVHTLNIREALKNLRELDIQEGRKPRNIFKAKIYKNGDSTSEFFLDEDLDRRTYEENLRREKEFEEKRAARAAQRNPEETDRHTEALRIAKNYSEKIYSEPYSRQLVLDFLYAQATANAPADWEEIRIEMKRVQETKTSLDQFYRSKTKAEFKRLNLIYPMASIDAISGLLRELDNGTFTATDITFTLTEGIIDYALP